MADDKSRVMTSPELDRAMNVVSKQNLADRYRPSGLTGMFSGTRLRRWEIYQVDTIRMGMQIRFGINSLADIEVTDDTLSKFAEWLSTCLVKSNSPALAYPGGAGIRTIRERMNPEELGNALRTVCEMSGVFDATS